MVERVGNFRILNLNRQEVFISVRLLYIFFNSSLRKIIFFWGREFGVRKYVFLTNIKEEREVTLKVITTNTLQGSVCARLSWCGQPMNLRVIYPALAREQNSGQVGVGPVGVLWACMSNRIFT